MRRHRPPCTRGLYLWRTRRARYTATRRDGRIRRAGSAPRRVVTPLEETCFSAEPRSAICVQRFDDSLNSAIRTTYRISLRSSSLREPRYPSAGVVCVSRQLVRSSGEQATTTGLRGGKEGPTYYEEDRPTAREVRPRRRERREEESPNPSPPEGSPPRRAAAAAAEQLLLRRPRRRGFGNGTHGAVCGKTGNDPSAGSPTETLLRLLLPLNDKVWTASRGIAAGEPAALPQSGGLTGSFNR